MKNDIKLFITSIIFFISIIILFIKFKGGMLLISFFSILLLFNISYDSLSIVLPL